MGTGMLAGAAVAVLLATLPAAAEDRSGRAQDQDMRRAIAFERQKQRAADRQARIEARRPAERNRADRRADRTMDDTDSGRRVGDPGERRDRK
jgi:hypothetical protein